MKKDKIIVKKKKLNKYDIKPVSYDIYRKIRAFKIYSDLTKDFNKPICYKDGFRLKFCMWFGGFKKWINYVNKLGLKENIDYVIVNCNSFRGPYTAVRMYLKENENKN